MKAIVCTIPCITCNGINHNQSFTNEYNNCMFVCHFDPIPSHRKVSSLSTGNENGLSDIYADNMADTSSL